MDVPEKNNKKLSDKLLGCCELFCILLFLFYFFQASIYQALIIELNSVGAFPVEGFFTFHLYLWFSLNTGIWSLETSCSVSSDSSSLLMHW